MTRCALWQILHLNSLGVLILFLCWFLVIELIKDLMQYDVQDQLLQSLVSALVPTKDELLKRPEIFNGK